VYIVISGIEFGDMMRIQFAEGYIVPEYLIEDNVKDFCTWNYDGNRIFTWTNNDDKELSFLVNDIRIAWILTSMHSSQLGRFKIIGQSLVDVVAESIDNPPPG